MSEILKNQGNELNSNKHNIKPEFNNKTTENKFSIEMKESIDREYELTQKEIV